MSTVADQEFGMLQSRTMTMDDNETSLLEGEPASNTLNLTPPLSDYLATQHADSDKSSRPLDLTPATGTPVADTESVTTASEASSKPADDPYRDPLSIPSLSPQTFVYPYSGAAIAEAFHERFQQVVSIFRHNIFQDRHLKDSIQHIDYILKQCGVSPTACHPAIVVFCRRSDFKPLRRLLMNDQLKFQYALRKPARKFPWRPAPASSGYSKPFFSLFFWCERRPRALYVGQEMSGELWPQSPFLHNDIPWLSEMPGLDLCGSTVRVTGQSRLSTLGSIVRIGPDLYAITSRHVVAPTDAEESFSISDDNRATPDHVDKDVISSFMFSSESDGSETPSYFVDDFDYGFSDDEDEQQSDSLTDLSDNPTPDTTRYSISIIYPTISYIDSHEATDSDWALVKISDRMLVEGDCPPSFDMRASHGLSNCAIDKEPPSQETEAFILTHQGRTKRGLLQPGFSILGGINGRIHSHVWTFHPYPDESPSLGDSGAIVLNASKKSIFGHVIGSNPIGEVYVSPYRTILSQIQRFVDVMAVASCPQLLTFENPEPFMRRSEAHQMSSSGHQEQLEQMEEGSVENPEMADLNFNEDVYYPCPYRIKNPVRFNVRSHRKCAMTQFNMEALRIHITTTHSRRDEPTAPTESSESQQPELPPFLFPDLTPEDFEGDTEDGISIAKNKWLKSPGWDFQSWGQLWHFLFGEEVEVPEPKYLPVVESHELPSLLASDHLQNDITQTLKEMSASPPNIVARHIMVKMQKAMKLSEESLRQKAIPGPLAQARQSRPSYQQSRHTIATSSDQGSLQHMGTTLGDILRYPTAKGTGRTKGMRDILEMDAVGELEDISETDMDLVNEMQNRWYLD